MTEGRERERLFAGLAAVYRDFETYRARTIRELPVIRLRPQAG